MDYENTILNLIEINKINRNKIPKKTFSTLYYLLTFCVVACDIGRGVGKTSFIKKYGCRADLVIVPERGLARQHANSLYKVITPDQIDKVRGQKFENIFIEEPDLVFREITITNLLSALMDKENEQTVIMLGRMY